MLFRSEELKSGHHAKWRELSAEALQDAGQHELLNWITLAGAMTELGKKAEVIYTYTDAELQSTLKQIEADGGRAIFVPCDVSSAESAEALVSRTVEELGGIDHLVNNAAIYGSMEFNLLISVDWDYYRRFMAVNLDGALVMTRAVHPEIAKRGGGAIVNQSSTAAYLYSGFYGLAKAGINSLTQQLAHELGGQRIRVNAIAPGPTDTEATRTQAGDAAKDIVRNSLAIKRMGSVDDMVGALLFLLSDDASWVTGQILAVDGGQTFRL